MVTESLSDPKVWQEAVARFQENLIARKTVVPALEFAARVNRGIGPNSDQPVGGATINVYTNVRFGALRRARQPCVGRSAEPQLMSRVPGLSGLFRRRSAPSERSRRPRPPSASALLRRSWRRLILVRIPACCGRASHGPDPFHCPSRLRRALRHARTVFQHHPDVEVRLNLRVVPSRRRQNLGHTPERRRVDRRLHPEIDAEVQERGWSMLRLPR